MGGREEIIRREKVRAKAFQGRGIAYTLRGVKEQQVFGIQQTTRYKWTTGV